MKYYFLLLGILIAGLSEAQTVRTDVVIVGNTESGVSAAIQAAHSGLNVREPNSSVKVLFIVEGNELVKDISQDNDTLFNSGIRANFLKLLTKARTDSLTGQLMPFTQDLAHTVLKGWTDTIKNLTIIRNVVWQKVEKSSKGWDIKLKDGKTIKADVVVDATVNGAVAAKAGIQFDQATGYYRTVITPAQIDVKQPYNNRIYRTSVAIGNSAGQVPFIVPVGSQIALGEENFILAGRLPVLKTAKQSEPATMASGQAAGAIAAYCSFFKTTTRSLEIRDIQVELMNYKAWLIPFADIQYADANFSAIQHIGVTGVLKGKLNNGNLLFLPDSTITAEELRLPMREYYSRSQLWFADNKIGKLTLGNTLSLIKFCASRGEELNKEVEKAWKSSFKFTAEYNLERFISRREFAVLANAYLRPFVTRVDLSGNLLN